MPSSPNDLRKIHEFPDLVRYLEDELAWPLDEYSFDDLTFEYSPSEVGLKDEDAAKIKEIHQLKPLRHDQPWGIFFVEFEKKKLPVVVLRRILNHLVLKKRASANKADARRWETGDILFISAFGDTADQSREIAFAHFQQEPGDLPTLRVLGWDGGDTQLHVEHVARQLKERLRWPDDPADTRKWREQWRKPFRHKIGHTIRTSAELAETLAAFARNIRDAARTLMAHESERGALHQLFTAFRTALIRDLTAESFADTYAQTITYGLLTAAISRTEMSEGTRGTVILAESVTDMVPVTNPFLKEMLQTFLKAGGRRGGIDFDELGVQDVVELLRGDETDLPAILRDFGNRTRGEDPVIHFYEHFLSAYNKKLKVERGVFYTPQPVVSYIVRSVHELLQTEFGLADGLADTTTWGEMVRRQPGLKLPNLSDDPGNYQPLPESEPFVQILDPATGTGTFLVEVIDVIHRTIAAKWQQQNLTDAQQQAAWNDYVPKHLLPRLHAFELMMAPYAIAHMKIGLKLAETGYKFGTEERARVYLTNALEPKVTQLPQIGFDALAHEAEAVNEIKWKKRFTIVIGNPPYSINSCNLQRGAVALVEPFRYVDGVKIQERGALKFETILQDDYVKFWGLGHQILGSTPSGIIGMITNNGFFANRVLRGLRKTLLNTFDRRMFFDLHGNRSKGEVCPDGSHDDNVFDINQGVGISILRRVLGTPPTNKVELADLWGRRTLKYRTLTETLVSTTTVNAHIAKPPYYAFALVDADIEDEYRAFVALDEIMPFNKAGFVSGRDDFAVAFDFEPLKQRIDDFLNPANADSIVRERYAIRDAGGYALAKRRQPALIAKLKATDIIQRVQHRPFDYRYVAYSDAVLTSPQKAAMNQMISGDNLAFCLSRGAEIVRGWEHIFCTRALVQHHTVSLKEVNYVFPLNIRTQDSSFAFGNTKNTNFTAQFLTSISAKLKVGIERASDCTTGLTPEEIFHYIYAVLYSLGYRSRYADFLKTDFPRLPLTGSLTLFRALVRLGSELVALHLLESSKLDQPRTTFIEGSSPLVEKISWSRETVWLDKAQSTGFHGVPEAVWNFHIGGYQVCEKWLKDRKGRRLSAEDIAHYHKIVVALAETIRLMAEIDTTIAQHGGWPGAFAIQATASSSNAA